MKLYLISQTENGGYDTFDSAVVAAPDENAAKEMHPDGKLLKTSLDWKAETATWCHSKRKVKVEYLGIAVKGTKRGDIICRSFNAG